MNKKGEIWKLLFYILLLISLAYFFSARPNFEIGSKPPILEDQVAVEEPVLENAGTFHVVKVTVSSSGFSPSSITVQKGTLVVFENLDGLHWIASDSHPTHNLLPGFDSGRALEPDDSFSYIFSESGTWGYHDDMNPISFHGVIIVN
ncbi:MAG: cupredoxin domain-containing protein [Nanoarchaeota archaeon]